MQIIIITRPSGPYRAPCPSGATVAKLGTKNEDRYTNTHFVTLQAFSIYIHVYSLAKY
jgi:hypothetical protein